MRQRRTQPVLPTNHTIHFFGSAVTPRLALLPFSQLFPLTKRIHIYE